MDVSFCIAILLLIGGASASCRFPGAPAHSRVTFSDEALVEGTYAIYACERGFELLGPARRVCGPAGVWTPDGIPFCVLNVAAGKAPMQISTEENGVPQRALDGSTAASFSADTCTLTRPERVPWWYVNLLEPYMVQLVRLDFGKPCCGANKPAVVIVRVGNNRPDLATNPVCNRFTGFIEEGQPLFLPCNPPMPGAFVSVHLEASTASQLSICEAFVYTDQALPIERCPQFRDQPPGSTATYNGKCYIFYDRQPATFRDALDFCQARGGTLVDESNPALQGFISWELWRRHRSDNSSQYWIGALRDPQDQKNWKWVNGNDVVVSFWNAPGGTGPCARFDGSKGWLWADTDCNNNLNYICQHQPKTCGRPEQPPNSKVAGELGVGTSVQYACEGGYLLVGPATRTCLETGFYDDVPPMCKQIECGFPALIPHGGYSLLNGTVSYLSQVEYSCQAGYEMAGRSRLVCDIDERWNGPPPRCEAIVCAEPPSIANGRVALPLNSSAFGAVAEYQCATGHSLRGAARLLCLANGLWDQPPPACLPDELETTTTTRRAPPSTETTWRAPPSTETTPVVTRQVLRRTSPRPSSPTPFVPAETPRPTFDRPIRPRPKTTTERSTTAIHEPPERKATVLDSQDSPTSHISNIIVANRSKNKEILDSGAVIRAEHTPQVNHSSTDERRESTGPGINTQVFAALVALGVLAVLFAIIATSIILFRGMCRGRAQDQGRLGSCHAGDSEGTSETESRSGLTRTYRRNWEDLHESTAVAQYQRSPEFRGNLSFMNKTMVLGAADSPLHGHVEPPRRHHHHHRHREPDSYTQLYRSGKRIISQERDPPANWVALNRRASSRRPNYN